MANLTVKKKLQFFLFFKKSAVNNNGPSRLFFSTFLID